MQAGRLRGKETLKTRVVIEETSLSLGEFLGSTSGGLFINEVKGIRGLIQTAKALKQSEMRRR